MLQKTRSRLIKQWPQKEGSFNFFSGMEKEEEGGRKFFVSFFFPSKINHSSEIKFNWKVGKHKSCFYGGGGGGPALVLALARSTVAVSDICLGG